MTTVDLRKPPAALPLQFRGQSMSVNAIDVEKRTVTLCWTTGAKVRRRRYVGWDTVVPFDEILVVSDKAIDLSRLNAGAAVLDSHSVYTTSAQVAVVERAWIEKAEGWSTIRFPKPGIDERADRMFGMVADEIIKNVSVGYSIEKIRVVEAQKKGDVEQIYVERWTPNEISFVTVPADPGAQVRGGDTYPLSVEAPAFTHAARAARMRMAEAARRLG